MLLFSLETNVMIPPPNLSSWSYAQVGEYNTYQQLHRGDADYGNTWHCHVYIISPTSVALAGVFVIAVYTLQGSYCQLYSSGGSRPGVWGGSHTGGRQNVFTCLNTPDCQDNRSVWHKKWLLLVGQERDTFIGWATPFIGWATPSFRESLQLKSALYH